MPLDVPFGSTLRRLRMAAGLSQEALAERANISTGAIGSYERGTISAPHRETAALIADALGLTGESRAAFARAARPAPRLRRSPERDPSASPKREHLPAEATALVGREIEIVEIRYGATGE